jgi:hypothetical protein
LRIKSTSALVGLLRQGFVRLRGFVFVIGADLSIVHAKRVRSAASLYAEAVVRAAIAGGLIFEKHTRGLSFLHAKRARII